MKNILVPTDFSVQSLQIVHQIVKRSARDTVRIHLVHMLHTPTDIMDLLFLKKYQVYQHVPDAFKQAMEMLKNKYPVQIAWMGLDFYYGSRVSILNDVIESGKIDEVCLLEDYTYTLPMQQSVNMMPLIARCKTQVNRLPLQGKVASLGEANFLSALFTDEYQLPVAPKMAKQN